MKFVIFSHSVVSCWNNANAHFLRGICRELIGRGHQVSAWEPADGWSRANAMQDGGVFALKTAERLVPGLDIRCYQPETLRLDAALGGADVAIVQDCNPPELIAAIGARRVAGGSFMLLFHDTRPLAPAEQTGGAALERLPEKWKSDFREKARPNKDLSRFSGRVEMEKALQGYDGVLACGEPVREAYLAKGWGQRVFTWHEAADTALFRPVCGQRKEMDLVWIGDWGDKTRSAQRRDLLLDPIARLGLRARFHGPRYPAEVQADLMARGIDYGGWLPDHNAPPAFARALFTVDIPEGPRAAMLPGIRFLEALACGIPLISTPWQDVDGLFPEGCYLTARNGDEMTAAFASLHGDPDLRETLIGNGLAAIEKRHSCAIRAQELLAILGGLRGPITAAPQKAKATGEQRLGMAL